MRRSRRAHAARPTLTQSRRRRRHAAATLAALTAALALTAVATAEITRQRGLVVSFNAGINPNALPRNAAAPVEIHFASKVRSADGSLLPQLNRVVIAINRYGSLRTRGVPTCNPKRLRGASSATALSVCRRALVGEGSFRARVSLPAQSRLPAQGKLLAFNARRGGRPAILVHAYTQRPVTSSVTIPLVIHRRKRGPFGTVLTAALTPELIGEDIFATHFELTLGRRIARRGRVHGYVNASCSAPRGFPSAVFTFARATYLFEDSRRVSGTISRTCRVRG